MTPKTLIELIDIIYRFTSGDYFYNYMTKSKINKFVIYMVPIVVILLFVYLTGFVLIKDTDEAKYYMEKIFYLFTPIIGLNIFISTIALEKIFKKIYNIITLSNNYDGISIIALMAKERFENSLRNIQHLFLFGANFIALGCLFGLKNASTGFIIMVVVALLIVTNYLVFIYRVKAGYFGNNITEAREVINYIKKHSSSFESGPGGGGRRILEDKSINDAKSPEAYGGLQHV